MIDDDPDIDLDDLTRDQLADRPDQPWADIASTLDEWLARQHGIFSGSHGVGLFLDLLTERSLSVVRDEAPPIESLLPPSPD